MSFSAVETSWSSSLTGTSSSDLSSQIASHPEGEPATDTMLLLIYGLILFNSQGWLVHSSPAKYDQRQEGDINVQIDLKDLKIIALVKSDMIDDYTNYDYAYDYADFTVKPIVRPTTKPPKTTTSTKPPELTTASSSTVANITNESASSTKSATTITDSQTSEKTTISTKSNAADETTSMKFNDDVESFGEITNATGEASSSITEVPRENPVLNQRQTKRCRKGFDKSGRCHRRRISLLPLAMKMAPELVRSVRKQISI